MFVAFFIAYLPLQIQAMKLVYEVQKNWPAMNRPSTVLPGKFFIQKI